MLLPVQGDILLAIPMITHCSMDAVLTEHRLAYTNWCLDQVVD